MLCAGVDCDDDNQCTTEACNPADGQCDYSAVADGLTCDFGALPGVCSVGVCEDAMLCSGVVCDDGSECTDDTCDPMDGLCDFTHRADGNACDFGGLPGVCSLGVCADAMLCSGVNCDDSNDCTEESCDPADGQCDYSNAADGLSCDFGGLPGVCSTGVCEDAMLCAGVDCDDTNECTTDTCNPQTGSCEHSAVTDGVSCDFGGLPGVCAVGICEDAMLCSGVACNDGNPCTDDACDPMDGMCDFTTTTDGTSCDLMGLPGTCDAGTCLGLCTGVLCDDSNECTSDACDPSDGTCDYTPVSNGLACTSEGSPGLCYEGACSTAACITNALCHTCPAQLLCDTDSDCPSSAYSCIPSGCETHQGAPIKDCRLTQGSSCSIPADCPADYDCISVGFGQSQCVKTTPGCNGSNDCTLGFSCEGAPGTCVDRRVPCDDYTDCPKSHVCKTQVTSTFCARVNRSCQSDGDCSGVGALWCADIDGDGASECAGSPGPNDLPPAPACLNSSCGGSTPICELAASSNLATCGEYGLCLSSGDCASGFECLGLWPDGRMECVQTGGTCTYISDCPEQQVCAAPWLGGPPSCQSGTAP